MTDTELLKELDVPTIPITRLMIALSERLGRWVSYSDMMDINDLKEEIKNDNVIK